MRNSVYVLRSVYSFLCFYHVYSVVCHFTGRIKCSLIGCKLNFMTSYLVKGWKIYAHAWMLCWWAGSAPVCDPKTFYQCANLRLAKYVTTNEAATCNCPRQCRHLSYNHDISQAVLSNYVLESGRNMLQSDVTLDELRMDYCSLEVSSKAEVCFVSSCKQLDCVSKKKRANIRKLQKGLVCWLLFGKLKY